MENDLERAIDIISKKTEIKNKDGFYKSFDKPYLYSNEGDFFKNIDLKDKSVLTVGSSGDQTLYSCLYGAEDVTLFDINPFTRYLLDLKISLIKTMSRQGIRNILHIKNYNREYGFA